MANPDPRIRLRRGTDTQRTDGTLGTPLEGEPCFTTDQKTLFIGDGSTAGGVPATKPASVCQLIAVTSQNINASTTNLVNWTGCFPNYGVDLSHTGSDPTKLTINTTGTYAITGSVVYTSAGVRYNGFLDVLLNGTAIGPQSACGYTRNASDHNHGSLHIPTFLYPCAATNYLQLQVTRESNVTVAADTIARRCLLLAYRVA